MEIFIFGKPWVCFLISFWLFPAVLKISAELELQVNGKQDSVADIAQWASIVGIRLPILWKTNEN